MATKPTQSKATGIGLSLWNAPLRVILNLSVCKESSGHFVDGRLVENLIYRRPQATTQQGHPWHSVPTSKRSRWFMYLYRKEKGWNYIPKAYDNIVNRYTRADNCYATIRQSYIFLLQNQILSNIFCIPHFLSLSQFTLPFYCNYITLAF